MASASILFLRPPPNVEFVQGFPGIPSHLPERPAACIKGVVELRPGGNGIKAKWVKVELRKIETLPGGGAANTYPEFIGESPVALWQAKDEWDELRARDFPFQIRIPESVPPSIALERNAGIKYELVASVFVKGKRGLLRREATPTITTSTGIVIDKHELHSAWPIYAQPESRSRSVDGYTLVVNRTHTAYGPGDRIAVQTFVKNDSPHSNQVRYYEFSLREHVAYRPGAQPGGRKSVPTGRTSAIQEQRIPISMAAPLHPGMQAKAELSLQVPISHTTTTVSWAHRIEVAYAIHVKAVLAGGQQLALDLPITMSNWTRAQSADAVRRIGPAANLSGSAAARNSISGMPSQFPQMNQQPNGMQPGMPGGMQPGMQWGSQPMAPPDPPLNHPSHMNMNVMPQGHPMSAPAGAGWPARPPLASTVSGLSQPAHSDYASEFGAMPAGNTQRPLTVAGMPNGSYTGLPSGGMPPPPTNVSLPDVSTSNPPPPPEEPRTQAPPARRRPGTGGSNPTHRFTVVNVSPEYDEDLRPPMPNGSSSQPNGFMSADDEKRRLKEAMDRVDKFGVQSQPTQQTAGSSSAGASSSPAPASQPARKWLSAEDEKAQLAKQHELYDSARNRAQHLQSIASEMGGSSPAVSSQSAPDYTAPPPAGSSSSSTSAPPPVQGWLSAEEEKAKLFREAQAAVERTQGRMYTPNSPDPAPAPAPAPAPPNPARTSTWMSDGPSPMVGGSSSAGMSTGQALYQMAMANMRTGHGATNGSSNPAGHYLSAADEKEALRYRRAVEAAQNIHHQAAYMAPPTGDPVPYEALFPSGPSGGVSSPITQPIYPLNITRSRSPPNSGNVPQGGMAVSEPSAGKPPSPPPPARFDQPMNARDEKEMMRKLYDAQDSAARQPGGTTVAGGPPPPIINGTSPTPPPPSEYTTQGMDVVLGNGNSDGPLRRDPTISWGKRKALPDSIPPPLPERPPAEYYRYQDDTETAGSNALSPGGYIDVRPFSPFNFHYDSQQAPPLVPPPPPPLPPKPPVQ
ncbi:hypothetical protein FRB99_005287 [Tulasnella sp. 403]|nr:hypothetical protein FRB99_005287 [Tulasnella sp. 403]